MCLEEATLGFSLANFSASSGSRWEASVHGAAPAAEGCPATMDQRPVPAENRGRLHQEQSASRQLAANGSQDQAIGGPPARSWSCASEDKQLLAEDEEVEIAISSGAAAEDEEGAQPIASS